MKKNNTSQTGIVESIGRRKILSMVSGGVTAIGGVPLVSASHDCSQNSERKSECKLADGWSFNCYFSHHNKFDTIYNDVKGWENSKVWLSHPEWADTVELRVGVVDRKSNYEIKNIFDDTPSGNLLMVAGDWQRGDNNVWHVLKGRINTDQCPTSESAYKYWFHEVGHAHGLPHRDEWLGQLMDPYDPEAMHLNQSECNEWNGSYELSSSTAGASSTGSSDRAENGENGDHDHTSHYTCSPGEDLSKEQRKRRREKAENNTLIRPTVVSKQPLGQEK